MLKRLYAQPLSARHVESDGLVYDPAQVNAFTAIGVSIPHGNHFHFIHYKDMSPLELEATRMVAEHRGHHIDALGKKILQRNQSIFLMNLIRNLTQRKNTMQ